MNRFRSEAEAAVPAQAKGASGIIEEVGLTPEQLAVCSRFAAEPDAPPPGSRLGIAANTRAFDLWPLNGLRHPGAHGTNGWYIWRGATLDSQADFFDALHVEHIEERCPDAVPYLALPPGWRFLLAPEQEDVWFDDALLLV